MKDRTQELGKLDSLLCADSGQRFTLSEFTGLYAREMQAIRQKLQAVSFPSNRRSKQKQGIIRSAVESATALTGSNYK